MMRTLIVVSALTCAALPGTAAAQVKIGSTHLGHKLLAVDSGVVLAKMPVQQTCPGWRQLDQFTSRLAREDVRVVSQFTITALGTVDSVQVVQSSYRPLNDAVVELVRSCHYAPAETASKEHVAARVEWPLTVSFGQKRR